MSKQAWVYVGSVLVVGIVLTVLAVPASPPGQDQITTWLILTVLATLAQLFKVEAPNHQTYYASLIFIFAALLLTSPFLFALLVAVAYLVEWAKERITRSPLLRNWYLQPFNIANHIIAGMAAYWVRATLFPDALFQSGLAILVVGVAAAVYVAVNHLLVGIAIALARRITLRDSGVLDAANLASDFVLLSLGYTVAVLWTVNLWLVVPALMPVVLLYRALMIPQLRREAQTDAKTGLWNAGHFTALYSAEFERARRFRRPLSVIMADLDLLRNVNNTYGHLAGDMVLAEIGVLIRAAIREYDTAGRFGGEEFAIMLPETPVTGARAISERLRHAVAIHEFKVNTSPTPIHVTMSFGIACHPADGTTPGQLIHKADLAVYQAKLLGRNRVVCAEALPASMLAGADALPGQPGVNVPPLYPVSSYGIRLPEPALATAPERQDPAEPPALPRVLFAAAAVAALVLAAAGVLARPQVNWEGVVFFAVAAFFAEMFHVDVLGDRAVSTAVLILFAAAIVLGVPGVVAVALVLALARRVQDNPPWWKAAFDAAAHILAGSATAFVVAFVPFALDAAHLPQWLIIALVLGLIFYLLESALAAAAIGLSLDRSVLSIWRAQYRWLTLHYLILAVLGLFLAVGYALLGPAGVVVFAVPVLMTHYALKRNVDRAAESSRELRHSNQELTQANREVAAVNQAVRELNQELFATLSRAMDARDPYVSGHAGHVARYSVAIAGELGLPADRLARLHQAALLHDLGKVGVDDQILNKPGTLSDEEYDHVKEHATLGANLLSGSQTLHPLAPFIRYHHEWWDGTGYPDGLSGEEIPLEARILAVSEAVEAMASERPYHRAMPLAEIIAEIQRCAGTQFDPQVVAAFVSVAQLGNGEFVVNSARVDRAQNAAEPTARV